MKAYLLLITLLVSSVSHAHHLTPCLLPDVDECKCVTPECAAGFSKTPEQSQEFCENSCFVSGEVACWLGSFFLKKKRGEDAEKHNQKKDRYRFFCNAGAFKACSNLCK